MQNEGVARFSVSLPRQLLADLDDMTRHKGYENRSLAVADMIRDQLVEHRFQDPSQEIVGTITIVYDHHKRQIQATLTDLQHDHGAWIISSMHIHLNHDHCLEVIAVRGPTYEIKCLADALIAVKGVKHGRLVVTSHGEDLPS
jgi:CopG family nickel-responsive transcriptional regulator